MCPTVSQNLLTSTSPYPEHYLATHSVPRRGHHAVSVVAYTALGARHAVPTTTLCVPIFAGAFDRRHVLPSSIQLFLNYTFFVSSKK